MATLTESVKMNVAIIKKQQTDICQFAVFLFLVLLLNAHVPTIFRHTPTKLSHLNELICMKNWVLARTLLTSCCRIFLFII